MHSGIESLSTDYSDEEEYQKYFSDSEYDEHNSKIFNLYHDKVNKGFIDNLRSAPTFITEANDAAAFFKEVFTHFDEKDLEISVGNEILITTRKLLQIPKIFKVFVKKCFLLQLPYMLQEYSDQIYAIISDILNKNLDLFSAEFVDKDHFSNSIRYDPRKALSIISNFAQKFVENDEINDPWPLLDVLVSEAKNFLVPELFDHFASLVLFLLQNNEEYCNARFMNFWRIFAKNVGAVDAKCRASLYITLCLMLELPVKSTPQLIVPIDQLKNDVKVPAVQESDLKLIYVLSKGPFFEYLCSQELIEALFSLAEENGIAIVVLLSMAENAELAKIIFGNGEWLLNMIPMAIDTLRLFLVIFSHQDLRPDIIEAKNFIKFLNFVLDELGSVGIITILCTVLRRIPLTKEFVQKLKKENFISNYLTTAVGNMDENKVAAHSLLLFVNTITKYGCYTEFLNTIPIIGNLLNDRNLCEIASYVAVDLANDEKCAKKMISLKFSKYFKEHLNDQKSQIIRHNAKKFLAKIKEYDE